MIKPVVLLILDGWGLSPEKEYNAVYLADTPHYDKLMKEYPHVALNTSGLAVGLPEGQMGNSEVGHLNIGSGRIVYQDLTRIDQEIRQGSLADNPVLKRAMTEIGESGKALHFMGLLSDGGVHSHLDHLKALMEMARNLGVEKVWIHGFLDGRDVPPKSAATYIQSMEKFMDALELGAFGTIQGRYYAMDRDQRWDRVELGYLAMAIGRGGRFDSAMDALESQYREGLTDEFILPSVMEGYEGMEEGDTVIFFNFRGDRAREISKVLYDPEFKAFPIQHKNIGYVCLTEYDENLGAPVAYPPEHLKNTLGEYLSHSGCRQVRIAETEKYAHVTFFFNGGVEEANLREDRILIPSPRVATYDLQPEMSIEEVTGKVLEVLDRGLHEAVIVNFANGDMVGHSGVLQAAIKAVEAVDRNMHRIVEKVLEKDGAILITADHGNAECMFNKRIGETHTAHTTNPVPFLLVSNKDLKLRDDSDLSLRDIAPTMLELLELKVPEEMTGKSILAERP